MMTAGGGKVVTRRSITVAEMASGKGREAIIAATIGTVDADVDR